MLLLLAFCTELGVTVAWSLVRDRLPPTIQVESVDGRFIGPLTVTGVTVESEGMRLQVDHARLDWRASRLLMAQVQIDLGLALTRPVLGHGTTRKRAGLRRDNLALSLDTYEGPI